MEEDIKILEENIENGIIYCGCGYSTEKAIRNLIARYKELEEFHYKVNEIMNFDEENLDTSRINNNYIGLKNCVTQFRNQVKELEKQIENITALVGEPAGNYITTTSTKYITTTDYIPKSKVKEKIEELEERNISYFDIVRYLKDLLEES